MSAQPLVAHPATPCVAIHRFSAELRRRGPHGLQVRYDIHGDLASLRLAPAGAPQRTDGLWRRSCGELFLMAESGAYQEFNFAPSAAWAAYGFEAYRQGMQPLALPAPPRITVQFHGDRWTLQAELEFPALTAQCYSLTAVIEDGQGALSYWALQHAAERPDFHHANSFVSVDI